MENIDASYYTDQIKRAQENHALAIRLAGIYNAKLNYHLRQAVNKAVHEAKDSGILAQIDYQNPKYRNNPDYVITAEDMKGHYQGDTLHLDKRMVDKDHIPMDDIATSIGTEYIVKGAKNIAAFETRKRIHDAENNALSTDPNIVPFEQLQSHRQSGDMDSGYTNISAYAALNNFATGQRGDLFAAMETIRENGARALKALPEGRERTEAERLLEGTVRKQENLLLPPVRKLMTQRRDELDAILGSHTFPPKVQDELRQAAAAAHKAVEYMEAHAKTMAVEHGLA